jgi:Domain of unknown function (DUF4203)
MLPTSFQLPAAVILVLGGAVACFAGYRFFRIVLTIYGFMLGAMLATTLAGAGEMPRLLIYAVVGGLVGALILNLAYFLGVVLIGAALGAAVVATIWGRAGAEPHVVVVVLFAVAGAVGAMLLQRLVIIVATAFGGAWTLLVGGLALAGDAAAKAVADAADVWVLYPLDPAPDRPWLPFAWLGLGLVGLVVQLLQGRGRGGRSRSRRR